MARVVFFDAYPHLFAGGQRSTLMIMRGLAERGWPVHLAVPGPGPFPDQARAAGFAVTDLDFPPALRVYGRQTTGVRAVAAAAELPALWRRLARWLPTAGDVAHLADHRGQLLVAPAARLGRLPVVWHIHGLNRHPVLNAAGAALARRIVVPSRAVAEGTPGLGRRKVTVAPYALPPEAFAVERTPSAHPSIVTVARLHPDKGLGVLLDAVSTLVANHPHLEVRVAGPPQAGFEAHRAALLRRRHQLGLDDVVEFCGGVPSSGPLLSTATVYVQPSLERTELQPIAVLEAMAAGVPVVASDVGAVREMLGGGQRGVLVRPGNPAALAGAIHHLLTDQNLAGRLSAAAAEYAGANCSSDRLVNQVEAVYRSL